MFLNEDTKKDSLNFRTLLNNYDFLSENIGLMSEEAIFLEGAKMDFLLKNYLDEGKDYRGLKAIVREVIKDNNLDDEDLRTKSNSVFSTIKRFSQIYIDIANTIDIGVAAYGAIASTAVGMPLLGVCYVVIGILSHLIWRLLRLAVDSSEFRAIKKDANDVIKMLESKKSKIDRKNTRAIKELDDAINKIKDGIEKYDN